MSEFGAGFAVLGALLMALFGMLAVAIPAQRPLWLVFVTTPGFQLFWMGLAPGGPVLRYAPLLAVPAVALPLIAVRARPRNARSRRLRE